MAIFKSESYKKGIIYSSCFNVAGKSVAFLQQWLIGYYFGTQSEVDVFFFTYNIILFLSYFFLNWTTSVLIPEGMRIRVQESEEASRKFFNTYIYIYAAVGILLFLLIRINPIECFKLISSFPPTIIENNVSLINWCIPIICLNLVVSIFTEILSSYKYFTVPNFVTFVNYVIGIIFIIFYHDKCGIHSIAQGLIIGYILNLIILVCMMKRILSWKFCLLSGFRRQSIFHSSLYSQSGYVVYLIALYVPQNIFSQLPPGSLTAINFADKILTIPSIFLVAQITNVMGVKMNQLVARKEFEELMGLTEKLLIRVSLGLLLVAVTISFMSEFLVDLLFSWGRYDSNMMDITARMLSCMIYYLPFSFCFGIYTKLFNAIKKQKYLFVLQLFTQGVTLVLYFTIIPCYGFYSYPLCRILPYLLAVFLALLFLKMSISSIKLRKIIISQFFMSVVTISLIGYILWLFRIFE